MNKFVKGALIFTSGVAGGFVLGGITTIIFVAKSDIFRTAVIISDEITTFLDRKQSKTERPFANVVFETRKDAEDVLSSADDICTRYGGGYYF